MKSKTNVNIHNRFDIEVIRDGKIIQRGKAENIVLDRIYDRLCNYQSYFSNIVYGSSNTGDLDPARETLFARIGSAAATTVETVKAFPVSTWTRKITLGLADSNEKWIREVGISDEGTKVNTHALLTKLDGTPLELYKTDLDIINIYATVFIELANKDANNFFVSLPNSNVLLNYLVGGNAPSGTIITDKHEGTGNIALQIASKAGSKNVDTENRKITYSARFSTTDSNNAISALILNDIYRANLIAGGVWSPYGIEDKIKMEGLSDKLFLNRYKEISDLSVKIDGENVEGCVVDYPFDTSIAKDSFLQYRVPGTYDTNKVNGLYGPTYVKKTKSFTETYIMEVDSNLIEGVPGYCYIDVRTYSKGYVYIEGSFDGESYTRFASMSAIGSQNFSATTEKTFNIPLNYKYLQFIITGFTTSYANVDFKFRVLAFSKRARITFPFIPGLVEGEELGSSDGIEDSFELVHSPIITVEGDPETDPPIPNEYALTIKFDDVDIDQSEYTVDENEIVFNTPPGRVYMETLGEGDDESDTFTFRFIPDVVNTVYIDGSPVNPSDYTITGNEIVFNTPPLQDEGISADYEYSCDITADYRYEVEITASYTVPYIPKSDQNVLDVSMEITFGPQEEEEEEEE